MTGGGREDCLEGDGINGIGAGIELGNDEIPEGIKRRGDPTGDCIEGEEFGESSFNGFIIIPWEEFTFTSLVGGSDGG